MTSGAITRLHFDEQPERLPPHNVEAEESILGSVLLDREIVGRLSDMLRPRDFYRERNETIFQAMLDLYERQEPVDYVTLIRELERTEKLAHAGGVTYLTGLLGVVPTPIHAESYARIVADSAVMRRLISVGGQIATIGFQNQCDPATALEKAERLLADVASVATRADDRPMSEYIREYLEELAQLHDGEISAGAVPTGFTDLDRLLEGGPKRGDLAVIAARPGMGKSTLMMNIVVNAAMRFGARSAVFSLEMSGRQLTMRVISAEARVEGARLRAGDFKDHEAARLGEAVGRLAEAEIRIAQPTSLTPSTLRAHIRRMARREQIDLVAIDYIQLMSTGRRSGNRVEEVSEITRQLKALALEEGVAVLALSQLSRAVEQRSPKIPLLSDLRESGSIEQDADVVLFIYRDDYYDRNSERQGLADLIVAKHRNGPLGQVSVLWDQRHTRFLDIEPSYQQETWV